jgi:hypothetical protein
VFRQARFCRISAKSVCWHRRDLQVNTSRSAAFSRRPTSVRIEKTHLSTVLHFVFANVLFGASPRSVAVGLRQIFDATQKLRHRAPHRDHYSLCKLPVTAAQSSLNREFWECPKSKDNPSIGLDFSVQRHVVSDCRVGYGRGCYIFVLFFRCGATLFWDCCRLADG